MIAEVDDRVTEVHGPEYLRGWAGFFVALIALGFEGFVSMATPLIVITKPTSLFLGAHDLLGFIVAISILTGFFVAVAGACLFAFLRRWLPPAKILMVEALAVFMLCVALATYLGIAGTSAAREDIRSRASSLDSHNR